MKIVDDLRLRLVWRRGKWVAFTKIAISGWLEMADGDVLPAASAVGAQPRTAVQNL
jgi:hypothetical protein